jgi:hypothetical protein
MNYWLSLNNLPKASAYKYWPKTVSDWLLVFSHLMSNLIYFLMFIVQF